MSSKKKWGLGQAVHQVHHPNPHLMGLVLFLHCFDIFRKEKSSKFNQMKGRETQKKTNISSDISKESQSSVFVMFLTERAIL
jgi:hypothetical protein